MWVKRGLLFDVSKYRNAIIRTHGSIPFALHLKDNLYRIFFSSRNVDGKSLPYYIDATVSDRKISLSGNPTGPLLQFGELGSFDDSGIMPSCMVRHNRKIYMYYIGWNPQVTVSYRLSIGLAISDDDGNTFKRFSVGPICDRSLEEPLFNTAPYVIVNGNKWRMWYISCTKWQMINGRPEPSYHVKYAESHDGLHWVRNGVVCLDYDERAEAIGRPSVFQVGEGLYRMFFSFRKMSDYRTSPSAGYKLAEAISVDGITWAKNYRNIGLELSNEGWDCKMMEYCHVFQHDGIVYMLYNGNGFGIDGFGYAVESK